MTEPVHLHWSIGSVHSKRTLLGCKPVQLIPKFSPSHIDISLRHSDFFLLTQAKYLNWTLANSFTAVAGAYQGGGGGDGADGAAGTPSKKSTPRKRGGKKKALAGEDGENDDDEASDFGSAKKNVLNKVKGGRVTKARNGGKGLIKQSHSDNEDEEVGDLLVSQSLF